MAERESSEQSFSESLDQLIAAVRALFVGHWSLLRAELGAIARDVLVTLIGAAAVVSLIVTALLGLLIALFLVLGEGLFGSQLWGAAHMTLILLSLAAAIASSIVRITTGRRARALLIAVFVGVGSLLLTLLPLGWAAGPAAGCAITLGLVTLLADLLVGLSTSTRNDSRIDLCLWRARRSCAPQRARWKISVKRRSAALPQRLVRRLVAPMRQSERCVARSAEWRRH